MDIDRDKIALLQKGKVPICEPGLEELIRRNAEYERLHFTSDLDEAVKKSLIIFITV